MLCQEGQSHSAALVAWAEVVGRQHLEAEQDAAHLEMWMEAVEGREAEFRRQMAEATMSQVALEQQREVQVAELDGLQQELGHVRQQIVTLTDALQAAETAQMAVGALLCSCIWSIQISRLPSLGGWTHRWEVFG